MFGTLGIFLDLRMTFCTDDERFVDEEDGDERVDDEEDDGKRVGDGDDERVGDGKRVDDDERVGDGDDDERVEDEEDDVEIGMVEEDVGTVDKRLGEYGGGGGLICVGIGNDGVPDIDGVLGRKGSVWKLLSSDADDGTLLLDVTFVSLSSDIEGIK